VADPNIATAPHSRSGCLTEAEVSRVRGAPSGQVPEDLAHHLAGCERCQERVLFGPVRRTRRRREMPPMPTSTRALILVGVMAAAIVAVFITLQRLLGRF